MKPDKLFPNQIPINKIYLKTQIQKIRDVLAKEDLIINDIAKKTELAIGIVMKKVHRSGFSNEFEIINNKVHWKGEAK